MDQQLISFEVTTQDPEALKEFLSEVLSLEITPGAGLFEAQLGHIRLAVSHGSMAPARLNLLLGPEAFADIVPRWQFYCFRHVKSFQLHERSAHELVFTLPDGMEWTLMRQTGQVGREETVATVRNC